MTVDIRARFLPRFAKLAAERVERSLVHVAGADWSSITKELHALSGEAALLELRAIEDLAREGERIARTTESSTECERVLRGGAFNYDARGLRATNRVHHPARFRIVMAGFRCARDG